MILRSLSYFAEQAGVHLTPRKVGSGTAPISQRYSSSFLSYIFLALSSALSVFNKSTLIALSLAVLCSGKAMVLIHRSLGDLSELDLVEIIHWPYVLVHSYIGVWVIYEWICLSRSFFSSGIRVSLQFQIDLLLWFEGYLCIYICVYGSIFCSSQWIRPSIWKLRHALLILKYWVDLIKSWSGHFRFLHVLIWVAWYFSLVKFLFFLSPLPPVFLIVWHSFVIPK